MHNTMYHKAMHTCIDQTAQHNTCITMHHMQPLGNTVHIQCSRLAVVQLRLLEAVGLVDDCGIELLVEVGGVLPAVLGPHCLDVGGHGHLRHVDAN